MGVWDTVRPSLIVDSGCDLTESLLNRLDVLLVNFKIDLGKGKEMIDDRSLNLLHLLDGMRSMKNPVKTGCPSPGEYADQMVKSEESFVVALSDKLSGSYNSALLARNMVLEAHPEKKIHVFDSKSASAGETCLAIRLRELIEKGLPFDEIVRRGTSFIEGMRTRFVLANLDNLMKNGRLSRVQLLLGSVLNIHPILSDDGNGEIVMNEKALGLKRALSRMASIAAEQMRAEGAPEVAVISHCNCEARALDLREKLLEQCAELKEITVVPTGGLSSVYANDGGIVLAYAR